MKDQSAASTIQCSVSCSLLSPGGVVADDWTGVPAVFTMNSGKYLEVRVKPPSFLVPHPSGSDVKHPLHAMNRPPVRIEG